MKSRTIKNEMEEDMRRTYLGEKVERGAKTEEKVSLSSEPKIEAYNQKHLQQVRLTMNPKSATTRVSDMICDIRVFSRKDRKTWSRLNLTATKCSGWRTALEQR